MRIPPKFVGAPIMIEELYTFEIPGEPIKWRRHCHEFRNKQGELLQIQQELVTKTKLLLKSQFHLPPLAGNLSLDILFVFNEHCDLYLLHSFQLAIYEQFIIEVLENIVFIHKGCVCAKTASKVLGKIPGTFITVRRCQ